MNPKIISFIAGVVVGSLATYGAMWLFAKPVDSTDIPEVSEEKEENTSNGEGNSIEENKENVEAAKAVIDENGYFDYSKRRTEDMKKEVIDVETPYVIPPEEFDEIGYETVSLTYYADGVLTDEDDNIIEDPETLIGDEALTSFGEYEQDSVFVRNDENATDYEILLDSRTFHEAMNQKGCGAYYD